MWTQVCDCDWVKKIFDGSTSSICYQSKVSKVRIRQNVQFSILTLLWAHRIVQMKRSKPISTLVFQRSMVLSEIFFMRMSSNTNKIETFEKYHETFKLFLRIALLLNTRYSSNIKDVPEDCIANFVRENNSEKFEELFIEVDSKNIGWQKNQKMHLYQLATIVYSHLMKLPDNKHKIKTCCKKFL